MRRAGLIAAFVLAVLLVRVSAAQGVLTLYFIDVEGGQSTLIVSPSGDSLLIDAGYQSAGRDAARIRAAMRDAGVTQIDHLLLTNEGVTNAAAANIANLDESTGNWLKATASKDGSFSLTNQRTQETRRYAAGSH